MFGHLLLNLGGGIDIHAIWKGVSGQVRVHGGGRGEGASPPPPRNWKKRCCQRNFNLFHLCFTYEIRGESIHCTSKVEGWADRRVSIVEGGEGALPPPKNVVRRNFNLFTYVLLMKLGGLTNTAYMQNGRGWADRRLSMVGGGGWVGGGGEGALPP